MRDAMISRSQLFSKEASERVYPQTRITDGTRATRRE
jgi:hypothetical protein